MFFRKKDEFRPERIDELTDELDEVHEELIKHQQRLEYLAENIEENTNIYQIRLVVNEYKKGIELHEELSKKEHQFSKQLKSMVKELEKGIAIYESLD